MDGNGRWAKKRNLPRTAGHRQGMKTLKKIVESSVELGINTLTVYAFSTENWKRPLKEVRFLMDLMVEVMKKELDSLDKAGVRVSVFGDLSPLAEKTKEAIGAGTDKTKDNDKLQLNIAFNYGGRQELIRAVADIVDKKIPASAIDEDLIADHLYSRGQADPDLLIRTSGEFRLSNFLLWQLAYTEIYVSDLYWPDFSQQAFIGAIEDYQKRNRRFGGI